LLVADESLWSRLKVEAERAEKNTAIVDDLRRGQTKEQPQIINTQKDDNHHYHRRHNPPPESQTPLHMDFDRAAQRFARDQNKLKAQRQARQTNKALSAKAQREAAIRKQQAQKLLAERQRKQRQAEYVEQYMRQCDRNLHVKALSSSSSSLQLQPTSIHGEGDKISLPPSVLEHLTSSSQDDGTATASSSPWTFRIGILNPNYSFPQSKLIQDMVPPDDRDDDDGAMDDDDDDNQAEKLAPYREELSHKYLAWTHGTVVEFTQEEGHVGLPFGIARALIEQAGDAISVTRTVDPAGAATAKQPIDLPGENDDENDSMDVETVNHENNNDDDGGEKTAGHLAWGKFDVPNALVEISLVQLPKGRACTLVPTQEALEKGFYNLKDIKLVLEQSLIRTRAVLSLNDVVHSWHRGVQYDVQVSQLEPADYHAVVCINTDITVEFGAPPEQEGQEKEEEEALTSDPERTGGYTLGGGRTLANNTKSTSTTPQIKATAPSTALSTPQLPPEPPASDSNSLLVQIRGPKGHVKRRFDVATANLAHLFALASTSTISSSPGKEDNPRAFRLVTRFPRRVFTLDDTTSRQTLQEAGLTPGQELLMVETF